FYEAILTWYETDRPEAASQDENPAETMAFAEWRQLNINAKNAFVAGLLHRMNSFVPFYPQDLTAKIDDLDHSGQIGKLDLADIPAAVSMLMATEAVRDGDFIRNKAKLYKHELMPQLPFF